MNDYIKAVEFASRRLGISTSAFIRILNEDAITSLVECAMRVEDATIRHPNGQLLPGMSFHKAIIMLGATLDTLVDIGVNSSAGYPMHGENDNNILIQPASVEPLPSYTSNQAVICAGKVMPLEQI